MDRSTGLDCTGLDCTIQYCVDRERTYKKVELAHSWLYWNQ